MKKMFLKPAVILFMLFSVTAIYGQMERHSNRSSRENRIENRSFYKELNEDQKAKLDKIRLEQRKTNEEFRKKMTGLREKRQSVMKEKDPDLNQVDQLIDEENALRGRMMKENVRRHREIRSELTPKQQEKLDSLRDKQRDRLKHRDGCEDGDKLKQRRMKKEKQE
jgi:Spy/CpxP family protein refolding chaperone